MFRVMIVDDEPLVRAGLRGSVDWAALGMAVTDEAANGREALERLRAADPPQVVLLDMEMPQMDGLRFLREVRDQQLPVQVIAVSNHEEYRYVRGALKLGAFDYLPKAGFDGTQLYAALQGLQGRLVESAGGELETCLLYTSCRHDACRAMNAMADHIYSTWEDVKEADERQQKET